MPADDPRTQSQNTQNTVPPATTAEPGTPLNLIDPKLKARALKRLQGIVKGNGIKIEDVKLEDCEAEIYPFQARTFVKLSTKYGVRTEPGLNRTAELAANAEAFQKTLSDTVVLARTDPAKRKTIVDLLFKRSDKGFGIKDQKTGFHALSRDLVMHEGCSTCSKHGKISCQKCHATGVLTCPLCQGRKQIVCPQCRGNGKMPGSNNAHSCQKCHGHGKISCHSCHGRGQTKCQNCAASGTLKCQKCAGSGWLSHLAHIELEAMIHFDFERDKLPVEVHKMIDAFGSRLVEKNDIEVVLRTQPVTQQEINDEIRAAGEPADMLFVDYEAKVPFGPIRFRMKDRVIPATLFGYHGKLIEAPSFLDDMTRKGQQVFIEAANNSGNVGEKIKRAARYRLLSDIIMQAAGAAKQRDAIAYLSNRYPTGISSDRLLSLLILADKALKNITRKPRAIGLSVGLGLFAALMVFYMLIGGRTVVAAQTGLPELGLSGVDLVLIPLGAVSGTLGAQLFSLVAQKRAIAGLTASGLSQNALPKVGKTLWWALSGAVLIWGACALFAALQIPAAGPVWLHSLLAS